MKEKDFGRHLKEHHIEIKKSPPKEMEVKNSFGRENELKETKCIMWKDGFCNSDYRKLRYDGESVFDDCPYLYKSKEITKNQENSQRENELRKQIEEIENKKLCYVEDGLLYFTSYFENVWGDDWDDVPYEHNAGIPYSEYNVTTVISNCGFQEPKDGLFGNSIYSVKDINNKKVAWIRLYDGMEIFAGTKLRDVISLSGFRCNDLEVLQSELKGIQLGRQEERQQMLKELDNLIKWGNSKEKDNTIYQESVFDVNEDWIDKLEELKSSLKENPKDFLIPSKAVEKEKKE